MVKGLYCTLEYSMLKSSQEARCSQNAQREHLQKHSKGTIIIFIS